MTQLAGKAKSASSESGTGQKGKFNLKFSGDSDKSQRKPVKSRQVKEMVILKNPRTVSRKHTGKAELPPNSQTDPRQNNVGNDPTRLEDNSQKNQSTLSTGKSLTTAGAINAEHFRKVTPKYAKDSMQSISYSKPPALESAVVAGPNDTIPVSDEPHSRKVGQPQFRSTASETVADTADNELNQSQWLLRERLRQHFMKLKQRISSQTGTEESKSDTLVSRWNRRLKHTLEPLWEGFRKYVESASKECHEQAHTWERKQKSTKDDSYASDCLNDAKDEPKLPERGYLEDIDFVADEFDMILRAMPEVPERNYLEDIDFVSKEFELFFRRKSNQQDEDSKAKSVQGTGSSDEEGEFVHSHLTTSDDKHFHHQNAGDMSAFSASPHYQPLLFNNEEEHLHQESELPPLHVSPSVSRNVLNPSEGPYQPLIFKQDSTNEDDSPKSTSSSKMRDTSKGHYQPLIFKRDSTNEDDSPKVTSSSKMRDTLKDHYQPLIFEGHNSSSNNYEPVTFINPSQSSSAARDTDLLEESRMNMASKHSKLPVRSSSIPVAPDSGTTPKVTIDNT